MVVKQIRSWQIPQGVVRKPAELMTGTTVQLTIEFDGHGYCLLVAEINGDYTFREWHPSLKAAEQSAAELFGPKSKDWETVGMQ
ncbi:MAG: hypothetical protein F6K11_09100 [Leptolyngbya sp. SIO3F4]|nr:hypothetical protein [Leptolyngbya sp. SIO3F4]